MTECTQESALPKEPGLYLAKAGDDLEYWHLLIYVYGESPFLQWSVWNYSCHCTAYDNLDLRVYRFGPKIANVMGDGLVKPMALYAKNEETLDNP